MIWEVYDLECLQNVFTYTGYRIKTKTWYQFVISPWRNDIDALVEHLRNNDEQLFQVGFNNEGYDYPLEHHILNNYESTYKNMSGLNAAISIYKKSQEIIDMEFSAIADKNKFIMQLDLFRIWHFNNKARLTS